MRVQRTLTWAVLSAFFAGGGLASANTGAAPQQRRVRAKRVVSYKLNPAKAQEAWGWAPKDIKRMLSIEVRHPALPGGKDLVATHIFPNPKRAGAFEPSVIPAHDSPEKVKMANGATLVRGDSELAKHVKPGEFAFVVHQRQGNPQYANGVLDVTEGNGGGGGFTEATKLQDTHLAIMVGVKRRIEGLKRAKAGTITLNMPQGYPGGEFDAGRFGLYEGGPWAYSNLTLLKPKYPSYVGRSEQHHYAKNMRTMLAGFNAVAHFPGDYNGGDPLSVKTPDEVRRAVKMMINGLAGNGTEQAASKAFFADTQNQLYCAEYGFTSVNAALQVPLNDTNVLALGVRPETWTKFKQEIGKHNSGKVSVFTSRNSAENEQIKHLKIGVAPKTLKPMHEYAPAEIRSAERAKMALAPMTGADIIANFLAVQFPRQKWGESVGSQVQGDAFKAMRPVLVDQINSNGQVPAEQAAQLEGLLDGIGKVIATDHGSYKNFRTAIAPLRQAAAGLPGLRYAPPHLFHLAALNPERTWTGKGLIGLAYEGTIVNAKWLDRVISKAPIAAPTASSAE